MNEQELVSRMLANDADAWEEFVGEWEPRLLRMAQHRVKAAAEDIAQETLLAVFKYLPRHDSSRPLKNVVLRIFRFKCVDHLRKEQRQQDIVLSEVVPDDDGYYLDVADNTPSHVEVYDDTEEASVRWASVQRAATEYLGSLESSGYEQKAQIVKIAVIEGKANKVAAEELGVPAADVANARFEATRKIGAIVLGTAPVCKRM